MLYLPNYVPYLFEYKSHVYISDTLIFDMKNKINFF